MRPETRGQDAENPGAAGMHINPDRRWDMPR